MVFGTSLIRTIRVYDRPFHGFLMICQKRAKMQSATLGMFTDKYLVLSYMVGTQIPPPPPNKKAGKVLRLHAWYAQKGKGRERRTKKPRGALGYFLGGYVPPGTPNWHPVLKTISP